MTDRARLAAIIVVLAAGVGTVYDLASGGAADPVPPPGPRATQATAPVSRADTVQQWEADILARPLIYPGRRAPSPAVAAAVQAPPEPVPRLTGVIIGPAGRSALFVSAQGARSVVVQEGGHVGPYVIRAIRSNEVVLEGPDGTRSLHPAYDGAPQPSGPVPMPPKRAGFEPVAHGIPPPISL